MDETRLWGNPLDVTEKGKISIVIYAAAIPLAFVRSWIAAACYIIVAIMWLIPDPRIERKTA